MPVRRHTLVAAGCRPREKNRGRRVKTVLGLSVTSHGIAWALVDGDRPTADLTSLDDDAFHVDTAGDLAGRAAAAARSAQAIAAASGQKVVAIGVCAAGVVSDHGDGDPVAELFDLLAAAGFDDVRLVPGQSGTAARDAALAVATDAVAGTPRLAAPRAPAPRRHNAVRAVAATAAAVAVGLLTVGSQFVEPVPEPAGDGAGLTAAAQPQLVTVITPRDIPRSVAEPSAEPDVSIQAAERAERAPIAEPVAEPVAAAETAVPHVVPAALPHLPAAQPHLPVPAALPAAEPHIAADPSPGPAFPAALPTVQPSLAPQPSPVSQPSPPPAGLWFLGAMP